MWVKIRNSEYWNPSKNLIGYNKHYSNRYRNHRLSEKFNTLLVKGTFDQLARTNFNITWKTIEHKTDKGYFKKVAVLSEQGRKKLKKILGE